MQLDRNGLEVLDREECLRLLASATLGRIGFTSRALPSVLPVNFHLDDRNRILVHTARGSRLDAALKDSVVAFEADELDPMGQRGWSVAVTGVAGPTGGSAAKPVGMVCFSFATSKRVVSEVRHFKGNRESVRRQSVTRALEGVLELLEGG